jgi:hypothetical protein
MELVGILRVLWARRILVGLGVLFAVAVGVAASGRASASVSWLASSRVLVDTPDSQLVRPVPKASDTVALRAALLADLVATEPAAKRIAQEAGVPLDQLAILGPSAEVETPVPTPLVTQAAIVGQPSGAPYVVRVHANGQLPIIAVEGAAPDAAHARALVNATTSGLRSLIATGETDGFSVEQLSPAVAEEVATRSQALLLGVGGAVFAFAFWCAAVVLLGGIAARLRGAVSSPVPRRAS